MQTVVTVMTILFRICLAEIVQKQLSTAKGRLCVCLGFLKQMTAYILFCHLLVSHELLQFLKILMRIESYTTSLATVTSGTTSLLIISLKTLRNVIVDYKANIRFVDTHTEGDSRHDNVNILHKELILGLIPYRRIKSGMIWTCLDVIGTENGSKFLNLLP